MANLAIVGSHSTNGVAAIHSGLLRTATVQGPRRDLSGALQQQNQWRDAAALATTRQPELSRTIVDAIGEDWITDLTQLEKAEGTLADDRIPHIVTEAKRTTKARFAQWLGASPASRSTRAPSLIARSSASTNTSGSS